MRKDKLSETLYEYSNDTFPRKLWVGCDKSELEKRFVYEDNFPINVDFDSYTAATISIVMDKESKLFGVLVAVSEGADIGVCAHEAVHAAFDILRDIGNNYSKKGEETYAYFIEWCFRRIYNAYKHFYKQKKQIKK